MTTNAFEDNYTCTANNGIGNQLSKTVSLKVHSKSINDPSKICFDGCYDHCVLIILVQFLLILKKSLLIKVA